jgi:hypothetical protein
VTAGDFRDSKMRNPWLSFSALSVACFLSGAARADKTYLVGGTVIEGRATRKGDKVVVEMESGEITLPADSVAKIEKSESLVSQFEARHAALRPGDVKGRLELADYCRDHDMRAREHQLLQEVLEVDPNHAAARARLGYVKTDTGWITEADSMRARGMVMHDGRWVSEATLRQIERQEHQDAEVMSREREAEDAADAARRNQANADRAELDEQRSHLPATSYGSIYTPYYYGTGYRTVGYGATFSAERSRAAPPHPSSWTSHFDSSMSVVKVPYRRH